MGQLLQILTRVAVAAFAGLIRVHAEAPDGLVPMGRQGIRAPGPRVLVLIDREETRLIPGGQISTNIHLSELGVAPRGSREHRATLMAALPATAIQPANVAHHAASAMKINTRGTRSRNGKFNTRAKRNVLAVYMPSGNTAPQYSGS